MSQFHCPVCNLTTPHEEPVPITAKKAVILECKKCGVKRTIENVHTVFCDYCKKLAPQQFRQDEHDNTITPICLYCGAANVKVINDKGDK